MASGSFVLGPGESTDGNRQCQARHGQMMTLRCQERIPEAAYHEDHWAIGSDGQTVRWNEMVAMYPAIDGRFEPPNRGLLVGEPGPEVVRLNEKGRNIEAAIGNGAARLAQVGGDHYRKFKIQPWDVIDEYGLGFYAGNALKYLLRAGNKGSMVEDLKKCRHYIDKLIEKMEEEG